MMMEQAKPAARQEPPAPVAEGVTPQRQTIPPNATAEERVQDLERRLNDLGGGSGISTLPAADKAAPTAAPTTGKSNPLLAAQERARLAEQKEKEARAAAEAELQRKKELEEQARLQAAEEERIRKAQSALRSVAGRALEDKQHEIMRQLEGRPPASEQQQIEQPAATPGIPIMKSMDPPPPSFDSMQFPPPPASATDHEMKGHGMNSRRLSQQPPSFDVVEKQFMAPQTPVEHTVNIQPPAASEATAPQLTPTAPPMDADHLQGIMPVEAPPLSHAHQADLPPPPSFDVFEQQMQQTSTYTSQPPAAADDDGIFELDFEGNPISPEQRQAMLEEQRQLYESIMKEKAANDSAIAQASADAFDQRSSSAAVQAIDEHKDSIGQNIGETSNSASADADDQNERQASRRLVKIGNNQTVALHGQERTKKAIKEGTAILVQCVNCQNWMQVTDTATLMFCPVCQVVSPVIKQNDVLTKEEAIQLTMDRKLAEKLQQEAYAEREAATNEDQVERGYLERLGSGVADATDSVWKSISGLVSYGVTSEQSPRAAGQSAERGELAVTRPPGAAPSSTYPGHRARINDSQSAPRNEETRGLLSPVVVDGNEANLPAGRVAESKPLFSCFMDSVNSAAGAVWSSDADEAGNVHGVDSTSLLMTNAGRGVGEGAGDYTALPDEERG
ncbi:hypothetical protein THAOC_07430 [Thalassiosira oceanica]|uniref:Uncharacterized protein n=1 Tax=Thalassiosira oceanica TaxID=159749 RepID=K0T1X5_THAOC|nr:hypothetical protein THAOC_07430 [Thalassiosira oceanica]|eukprot:EJK71154.1 hypothetical protein THAOC_07430 [Thalassiosira oceanica]